MAAPGFQGLAPSTAISSLSLEVRALDVGPLNPGKRSGEHCKLPSGVWGEVPTANNFDAF